MKYWIIEHPSRGCFVEWNEWTRKPRFSWSCYRTDPQIHPFWTEQLARKAIAKFPPSLQQRCALLIVENGHIRVPKTERKRT